MTDKKKQNDDGAAEESEGQIVGYFAPKGDDAAGNPVKKLKTSPDESKAFERDFYDTLDGKGEGLMPRHLFHEPPKNDENSGNANSPAGRKKSEIYGTLDKHFGRFLYGASAWHEITGKTKTYDGITNDNNALAYAVRQGLADLIPGPKHIVEYGPGDRFGVAKTTQVIDAFNAASKDSVKRYVAVDINSVYALDAAKIIHQEFNIRVDAVKCDFMTAERINVPEMSASETGEKPSCVFFVFGGIFANAPDYSASGGKSSEQNATTYFSRMSRQGGIGSHIVMTYDAENHPQKLLEQYQATEAFNAFVLSSHTRAVGETVITDDFYDPFRYWEMKPSYDPASKKVRLCAVCKESHIMQTKREPLKFERGKTLTNILSHKWNGNDYSRMFESAGIQMIADFREPGAAHGVIIAKIIRPPDDSTFTASPK